MTSAAASTSFQALNYYDVLDLEDPEEASLADIKQAYKRAARLWHPDKARPKDKALAERRFKEVSEAYTVLCDEKQRQLYDLYLSCRPYGFVEVADPDDPRGAYVQVPFTDWDEFQRILNGVASAFPTTSSSTMGGHHRGHDRERRRGSGGEDDLSNEPPLSVFEWLVAGGVLTTICFVAVFYHRRRQWLEALPFEIWRHHCTYTAPLGWYLSPFFFGNVPFGDAADYLRSAMDSSGSL
eukprot:TRINITY_DN30858_c0_g1_i1.p1 TRINITY_DN30858_c0_g1~~TRINITY_DN30858_c0_g1_i1.p1  ORF type:complete len:239 (+),score=44.20 TRINITY_DN30858_c0_g1_i1:372-1088(+)